MTWKFFSGRYVDFFTISTHYLVDEEEAFHTFHPSRLMGLFDMLNTDSVVDLIIGMGAPKPKILMAVPASAYKFVLKNQNENTPRSPTKNEEPVALDRKEVRKYNAIELRPEKKSTYLTDVFS